jgi:hypothetical protein
MEERRKMKRMILDESSILDFNGAACFIVDACTTGLGITFISATEWPEKLNLKYTLPHESGKERRVECRTIWESSMDYYKTGSTEIVRRRGLEFIDPDSENVDSLFRHLSAIEAGHH